MIKLAYIVYITIYEENDDDKSLQILEQLALLGNINIDDWSKSNHTSSIVRI
jgi:hypothetical protein